MCCGAKEALGAIWLLCSDTLRVWLCRLGLASPRWTFWSLLGMTTYAWALASVISEAGAKGWAGV